MINQFTLLAGIFFFTLSPFLAVYSYYNGGSGPACAMAGVLGWMIGLGLISGFIA